MNKFSMLLAAALVLASCAQPLMNLEGSAEVAALIVPSSPDASSLRGLVSATSPVALFSETSRSYYIYHGISGVDRVYQIIVADLDYTKAVNIRFEMADGTWKDYPASFVADLAGGDELWEVRTSGTNGWGNTAFIEFGDEFAVNYTVKGQTYWDNNAGKNYTDKGYYLRSGTQILRNSANGYNNNLLVRNLGFQKKVTVVYTLDGWATTKTSPAYFSSLVEGLDLEIWNWYINEFYTTGGSGVEYCFSYEVNGQTFWDNNFGRNYIR